MTGVSDTQETTDLRDAISAAMLDLYAAFYGHHRTTATTYINDSIIVCVLEKILTGEEGALIADGADAEVIDGRVAFQTDTRMSSPPRSSALPIAASPRS